jgi:NTE family protein
MLPLLLNKMLMRLWEPTHSSGSRGAATGEWARRPGRGRRSINLALQGGGAHGAFTWGVLDQLLADGRLSIEGISGTSAGAVNAVVLAAGLAQGGSTFARQQLAAFWRSASLDGRIPELQRRVLERLFAFVPRSAAPAPFVGALSRFLSPYDLNPLNINPLKELIDRFVDFEAIRAGERELFITATHVSTGAPRVFTRAELTAEAVMASACLPLLFQAVEIDGEAYWDGGYSGNPTLVPFLTATGAEDVLIVQINPREREGAPTGARKIMARVQEIAFNAPLLAELRTLDIADALMAQGLGGGAGAYRRLRLHCIALDGPALDGSKLDTAYEYFQLLHKLGQRATRRFLDAHWDDIGRRSTLNAAAPANAAVA